MLLVAVGHTRAAHLDLITSKGYTDHHETMPATPPARKVDSGVSPVLRDTPPSRPFSAQRPFNRAWNSPYAHEQHAHSARGMSPAAASQLHTGGSLWEGGQSYPPGGGSAWCHPVLAQLVQREVHTVRRKVAHGGDGEPAKQSPRALRPPARPVQRVSSPH
jgi:hypothetical protein